MNTSLETSDFKVHPLYQERSLVQIFRKATIDYIQLGFPYIRALILPTLMVYGGAYAGLLGALSWGNSMSLALLLVVVLGLGVFFVGFWQLVVYFASFNQTYLAVLTKQPAQCSLDAKTFLKQHQGSFIGYINSLIVIQLAALIIVSVLALPFSFFVPEGLLNLIVQIMIYLPYTLAALGFQILSLGNPQPGFLNTLKESFKLVKADYFSVLFALVLSFILTYYLLPGIIVSLAELSGGISLFNHLHQGAIYNYLTETKAMAEQLPPDAQAILNQLSLFKQDISIVSNDLSHQLSQTLLTSIVNTFLLPWGTFIMALLYGSIVTKNAKHDTTKDG